MNSNFVKSMPSWLQRCYSKLIWIFFRLEEGWLEFSWNFQRWLDHQEGKDPGIFWDLLSIGQIEF